MMNLNVPLWEKYTLTIAEAAEYFRIGEHKLRRLAEENPWGCWSGICTPAFVKLFLTPKSR